MAQLFFFLEIKEAGSRIVRIGVIKGIKAQVASQLDMEDLGEQHLVAERDPGGEVGKVEVPGGRDLLSEQVGQEGEVSDLKLLVDPGSQNQHFLFGLGRKTQRIMVDKIVGQGITCAGFEMAPR